MTLVFESTSSISYVFVFDVKNSLSKQESKCLYTALSLSLCACSLTRSRSVVSGMPFKLVYHVRLVLFKYFVFGVRVEV